MLFKNVKNTVVKEDNRAFLFQIKCGLPGKTCMLYMPVLKKDFKKVNERVF